MAEKKVSRKKVNMNAASSNEEENLESGVKEQSLNTAETNSFPSSSRRNRITGRYSSKFFRRRQKC
jgi:hypothetical protein